METEVGAEPVQYAGLWHRSWLNQEANKSVECSCNDDGRGNRRVTILWIRGKAAKSVRAYERLCEPQRRRLNVRLRPLHEQISVQQRQSQSRDGRRFGGFVS
jgi:hypothetical protein